VARALGLVRPIMRLQRLAVVSHWNGLSAQNLVMRSSGSAVCGMAPLAMGRANVTLVVKTAEAASLSGRSAEFLVEAIKEHFPDLHEQMEGAVLESVKTIGCFGHVARSPVADGAMLVGDSACFIDPFTGEGIYMALRGAELAAGVAARALRAGNTSAASLADYDALREELRRRYRLCDLVQAIVRTPLLFNRVVAAFNRGPAGRDRVMAVLGDLQPAAAVLNPLLLADILAIP
jgi:flavin-dependent dehydrogenase